MDVEIVSAGQTVKTDVNNIMCLKKNPHFSDCLTFN